MNFKKHLLFAACAVLLPFISCAQNIAGKWVGELDMRGQKIRLVFSIQSSGKSGHSGTMESPEQGVRDIALTNVSARDGKFRLEIASLRASFFGTLGDGAQSAMGEFTQNETEFPMELKKLPAKEVVVEKKLLGAWEGSMDFSGQTLRIKFNIAEKDGDYRVTAESPDQNAKDMPVFDVEFEKGAFSLSMPYMRAKFSGKPNGAFDAISGRFNQFGTDIPLTLKKQK